MTVIPAPRVCVHTRQKDKKMLLIPYPFKHERPTCYYVGDPSARLGFGVFDSKTLVFDINTPRDHSRWDMSGRSTYKQFYENNACLSNTSVHIYHVVTW